ncbi:MAG: flagellar export protein FliJ [Actinobacteria bacterium]|nr:flagellar export protein FliJ [Actinomycetota bacterium]MBI3257624.1 flagellar export protein FliJ [Actinomycetota bacterium]
MKRYRFRLDPVLRVRRVEEERSVAVLAQAQRAEQRAQQLQISRFERYHSISTPIGTRSAPEFLAERAQIELVAAGVVAAAAAHELAVIEVNESRRSWAEAAGRVTSLENLDERHRGEHLIEVNKAETAALDELTSARFGRQR